jgi:hypothetical protein
MKTSAAVLVLVTMGSAYRQCAPPGPNSLQRATAGYKVIPDRPDFQAIARTGCVPRQTKGAMTTEVKTGGIAVLRAE